MAETLTVPSPLLTKVGGVELTPAQRKALWLLAAYLDERRVPAPASPTEGDAVWVEVPTKTLRGEGGRSDNVWLRELLERMTGVRFGGKARSNDWGAVLLAQWEIINGGTAARLLIPPAGLAALRSPDTFAKIDAEAVHRLPPHARTLYGLLADRQRQEHKRWTVEVDELRALLGVADKYQGRFNNFRHRVLQPAVAAINDFGVIALRYEEERRGRAVVAVKFWWSLKDLDDACATAKENDRHSKARRKVQEAADAPPLVVQDARRWWTLDLTPDRRERLAEKHGAGPGDKSEAVMVAAYEAEVAGKPKPR
jgi:hypothetical protein